VNDRNLTRHLGSVDADDRARVLGHRGACLWFTGLSGSGKSTLAREVEERLVRRGVAAYVLDGDNVRLGLNRDLGFGPADRAENIRRIGEVAALFVDAGVVVLAAFISPYRADRDAARAKVGDGFVEVHVAASLEVCEARDPKGLYKRARAGEIPEFTGVGAPYEAPSAPEIRVDTGVLSLEDAAAEVVEALGARGLWSA
jgi:adenylylsulfate kinase